MHILRKSIADNCPVCVAEAFTPCIQGVSGLEETPTQLGFNFDGDRAHEIACLELEIMQSIRELKKLNPEHTLVTVVAAVLRYQATETGKQPQDPRQ